jgi:hypothetical protein
MVITPGIIARAVLSDLLRELALLWPVSLAVAAICGWAIRGFVGVR